MASPLDLGDRVGGSPGDGVEEAQGRSSQLLRRCPCLRVEPRQDASRDGDESTGPVWRQQAREGGSTAPRGEDPGPPVLDSVAERCANSRRAGSETFPIQQSTVNGIRQRGGRNDEPRAKGLAQALCSSAGGLLRSSSRPSRKSAPTPSRWQHALGAMRNQTLIEAGARRAFAGGTS